MPYKIFDTLLEPTFVIDADHKILYCNEPGALIADSSVRKLCRSGIFSQVFLFENPFDLIFGPITKLTEPSPYKELHFKNSSGKQGKVQITLQPYRENEWLIYFRDVTLEETLQKKYRAELEQKEGVIVDLEKAKSELENYSKNLEKMVEERTREIQALNTQLSALLNSLGQGFFIFNKDGQCQPIYSKACETILETVPAGKKIWDIFHIPETKQVSIQRWIQALFLEPIPFADLAVLGPQNYTHSHGRDISIEYYPIRDNQNLIEGVVVVASDITELVQAQKEAETEKQTAKLIMSLVKNKKEITSFIRDAQAIIDKTKVILKNTIQASEDSVKLDHEELYRHLHTLKGGAASFGIQHLVESVHHCETLVSELKESDFEQSLKLISLKKNFQSAEKHYFEFLEKAKEFLGTQFMDGYQSKEISHEILNNFYKDLAQIPDLKQLQNKFLLDFICDPIESHFNYLNDVMIEIADRENKKIRPLEIINGKTPILSEHYSELLGTLIHAFRNALDHGIELPEVRLENGKAEAGQIQVSFMVLPPSALQSSELLQIQIRDDGNGIDPLKMRSKLSEKGISTENLSDHEVIQYVFASGVSTKELITDLSGRGVGMDAIKYVAESMQGRVWVESKIKKGTSLFIEVPYILNLKNQFKKIAPKAA